MQTIFTQWIMGDAFKNDAVGCKKESSLCWQDVWAPQEAPSSFLPAIRVQKHPQPLWHQVLSRKKCWSENLGLMRTEHNDVSQKGTERHVHTRTQRNKRMTAHMYTHHIGTALPRRYSKCENICHWVRLFKVPGNQVNVILSNCKLGTSIGKICLTCTPECYQKHTFWKHIKNLMALEKNKIANKNIIPFPDGAKVTICLSYKRFSAYEMYWTSQASDRTPYFQCLDKDSMLSNTLNMLSNAFIWG